MNAPHRGRAIWTAITCRIITNAVIARSTPRSALLSATRLIRWGKEVRMMITKTLPIRVWMKISVIPIWLVRQQHLKKDYTIPISARSNGRRIVLVMRGLSRWFRVRHGLTAPLPMVCVNAWPMNLVPFIFFICAVIFAKTCCQRGRRAKVTMYSGRPA